jgi:2'-5' RNA ligase
MLGRYSVEEISEVFMYVVDRDNDQHCSLRFRAPSGGSLEVASHTPYCHEPDPLPEVWPFPFLLDQAVLALLALSLNQVASFALNLQDRSEFGIEPSHIRGRLAEVFEKCPRLQEVVLEDYDPGHFPDLTRDKIPPIRILTIKHPKEVSWEELVENVTEVARVRYSKEMPLERIEIFTAEEHPRIEELESLVSGEVKYRNIGSWEDHRKTRSY